MTKNKKNYEKKKSYLDIKNDNRKTLLILYLSRLKINKDTLFFLLENSEKDNINVKCHYDMSPLMHALRNNCSPDIINLLIDYGANVNEKTNFNECNEYGDKIDIIENTPLIYAASGGYISNTCIRPKTFENSINNVRIILDRGAYIDAKNSNGDTALSAAIANFPVAEFLIERGADVSIVNNDGNTLLLNLLYTTIYHNNYERFEQRILNHIRLIIEKGVDINHKNKQGINALMIAIEYGCVDEVKLLLELGADVNIIDNNGNTLIEYAIINLEREYFQKYGINIIKLLLAYGCSSYVKEDNVIDHIFISTKSINYRFFFTNKRLFKILVDIYKPINIVINSLDTQKQNISLDIVLNYLKQIYPHIPINILQKLHNVYKNHIKKPLKKEILLENLDNAIMT